ncbi:hypothetical protein [Actibacterium sp. MT2.3-13A]|uniref:hypothetical protein n=1 Tax=Actibacterium sp. MT2.3-13A TaxID=2828332 RepID=UPI001BAC2F28|nr:hypothetical protein [Actibacterium sp. MT2.3-13A]
MTGRDGKKVRRRRVFYIPGYDPIHPRRYRELYRKEGAAQAAVSGHEIALRPKTGGGPYGWHVAARIEGAPVETDFEVLVWSDIVRDSMAPGIGATYLQLARTAWIYIASGALPRLVRLRQGPVIAAFYPVLMLLGQLALALLVARGAGAALALSGVPFVGWLGLALAWPVLAWFRRHDNRLYAYYLMHDYAFSARWRGANPPALEARLEAFRDTVAEALRGEVDEVLVVGHSSGAHLAVSVLADLIRAGAAPKGGPALSLLTLGQVVPMVSFLPQAGRLRADLAYLSARDEIAWVDVTAPGDGCAFALCDPVSVSGVAPKGKRWPLVISAAFTRTLSPARWQELRWRFFRLHFQYLCAFDRPGDYDYFRVTAGPMTLGARYAGRAPSKSRIETPLSPYRSVAP